MNTESKGTRVRRVARPVGGDNGDGASEPQGVDTEN